MYTTAYSVTIAETDTQPINNKFTKNTEFTAITYARDDNTPINSLGVGSGHVAYLG